MLIYNVNWNNIKNLIKRILNYRMKAATIAEMGLYLAIIGATVIIGQKMFTVVRNSMAVQVGTMMKSSKMKDDIEIGGITIESNDEGKITVKGNDSDKIKKRIDNTN